MLFCQWSSKDIGIWLMTYSTLKWHFSTLEADDRGLNETRANACEIVAWRFLSRVSERDAVEFCLYELPRLEHPESPEAADPCDHRPLDITERSTLLPQFRARDPLSPLRPRPSSRRIELLQSVSHMDDIFHEIDGAQDGEEDPTSSFTGLNGLEIAAVADCKKFLSQRIVQKIITGIWNGRGKSLSFIIREIRTFFHDYGCRDTSRLLRSSSLRPLSHCITLFLLSGTRMTSNFAV
jgi:hypothetical protein